MPECHAIPGTQDLLKSRFLGSFKPLELVYQADGIVLKKFPSDSDELLSQMTH